jgi:hypothetical protein
MTLFISMCSEHDPFFQLATNPGAPYLAFFARCGK